METGTGPTFRRTEKTLKNEMRRSPEKYKDQHVTLITFHVSAWTKLLNWIIIFSVCGEEVSEAQKIRCFVWSLPPGKWPSLHPLYKVQPLYHILPYKCLPQSCTSSGNQATLHVRTEAWEGEQPAREPLGSYVRSGMRVKVSDFQPPVILTATDCWIIYSHVN